MHSFKDTKGRLWELNVTVAELRRVRDRTGVNLYGLVEDGMKPLAGLERDPCKFCEVLYALFKGQADRDKVSPEDFEGAMAGDALQEARDAFLEALSDFFPSLTQKILSEAWAKAREVRDLATVRAGRTVGSLDPARLVGTLNNSPPEVLSASSGNSRESAASTPDP